MSNNKHVLVVDDDSANLEFTATVLADQGMAPRVALARDGREALDYLFRRGSYGSRSTDQPAVVLLDLKMPQVDGFEVLRQLKNHDRLKVIPVVVFTSSSDEDDMSKCYQLGANGYVVKPVDFEEFSAAISALRSFWMTTNNPPPFASLMAE